MAAPDLPELEGVSHSYPEARGVRFHVAEAGAGEPLVLLHGWPQNWWCWHKMIPGLARDGFRVLAVDLRGYGWSERPRDGYDDSMTIDPSNLPFLYQGMIPTSEERDYSQLPYRIGLLRLEKR